MSGSASSVVLNGGTFTVNPGSQVVGPLNDTVSLLFEGGTSTTWNFPTTEAQAYANTDNVASAIATMDFSALSAPCQMNFNLELYSGYSNARYANMRVKVNGVVIPDVEGNTSYFNGTGSTIFPYGPAGSPHVAVYDLSLIYI